MVLLAGSSNGEQNNSPASSNANTSNNPQDQSRLSPEEKAALIGLIPTVPITIIGILTYIRERRKRIAAEGKVNHLQGESEALRKSMADSLITKAKAVLLKATLKDLDGTIDVLGKYDDVEITREGVTLTALPGGLWFYNPGVSFIKEPELVERIHTLPSGAQSPIDSTLLTSKPTAGIRNFNIAIGVALNVGHKFSYQYIAEVAKGFLSSKEDMENYATSTNSPKFEYWCFTVPGVIESLVIHVNFRDGYKPVARPGVWIGDVSHENRMESAELSRVSDGFSNARDWSWVKFEIENPRIGFCYAIYWIPPTKASLELAKKGE
jgi:hypothetical protein